MATPGTVETLARTVERLARTKEKKSTDVLIPVNIFDTEGLISGERWRAALRKAAALMELNYDKQVDPDQLCNDEDVVAVCTLSLHLQKKTDDREAAFKAVHMAILDLGQIKGCVTGVRTSGTAEDLYGNPRAMSCRVQLWNRQFRLQDYSIYGKSGIDLASTDRISRSTPSPFSIPANDLASLFDTTEKVFKSIEGGISLLDLYGRVNFHSNYRGQKKDLLSISIEGHFNSWTKSPVEASVKLIHP